MLRAGVVGLGKKGFLCDLDEPVRSPESHVGAYVKSDHYNLVAVCDRDEEKIKLFEEKYPNIPAYTDLQEMLYESKIQVLSVVTPVDTHCEIVRLAARYHPIAAIFCEKPIASTLIEAKRMIRTCKNFGVGLAINHQRRWDSRWIEAKSMVEHIKPLRRAVGYCSGDLLEAGIHMMDLFRWMAPGVPYTYIDLKGEKPYKPYLFFEVEIFGEKGMIRIKENGDCIERYLSRPSRRRRYKGLNELEESGVIFPPPGCPMLAALENIAGFVRDKRPLACTGEDGLEALRMVLEEERKVSV